MCGFAGVIKRNVVEDKDVKDVMRMNEMIRYRGPDSEGYYNSDWFTCANSRLAIIDLNERANLPMFDDEKRYILFLTERYTTLKI